MNTHRNFRIGMRLGAGFFATIFAAIVICIIAIEALFSMRHSAEIVISNYAEDLIDAGRLHTAAEESVASGRAYLITGNKVFIQKMRDWHRLFSQELTGIRLRNSDRQALGLVGEIDFADVNYQDAVEGAVRLRAKGVSVSKLINDFETVIVPLRLRLEDSIDDYSRFSRDRLAAAKTASDEIAAKNVRLLIAVSAIALGLAASLAFLITRTLTKLYREVEDAVRMREEIVEVVSHDLKNPLSSIMLNVQMLKRQAAKMSTTDLSRTLTSINHASERMKNLVFGLLDLSKMRAGTFAVDLKPVRAADLVTTIIELIKPLADQKEINLSSQIQDPTLFAFGDREKILQVLSNLAGNALKFTPPGGIVVIALKKSGREILFSVSDNGPGIPEEQLKIIFSRYWQGGPRSGEGAGLGLAIAKGIVEAHGGRIWADSAPRMGTTFSFVLRAARAEENVVASTPRLSGPQSDLQI